MLFIYTIQPSASPTDAFFVLVIAPNTAAINKIFTYLDKINNEALIKFELVNIVLVEHTLRIVNLSCQSDLSPRTVSILFLHIISKQII